MTIKNTIFKYLINREKIYKRIFKEVSKMGWEEINIRKYVADIKKNLKINISSLFS